MKNRNINQYNYTDRMAAYIYIFLLLCIAATALYKFTSLF